MKISTRIDIKLVALVGGINLLCLAGGIGLLIYHRDSRDIVFSISAFVTCLLVLFISIPTRYELTPDELLIRGGPFRWRIALTAIEEVHKTGNPLFAPAWSHRRLQVFFKKKNGKSGWILISPKNRESFMHELSRRNPKLKFDIDRLVTQAPPEEDQGEGV